MRSKSYGPPLLLSIAFLLNLGVGATTTSTTQPAMDNTSYILTPPASQSPRINGPQVYGQHPGRPFLYSIPVTGQRPIVFSATGLPDGLKLDNATGFISGSVSTGGEFTVTLGASNSIGHAEKIWRLIIGDKIALTPPMGWNSWNCWADAVDQEKVTQSARAMVSSGLANHGWTYINIDDTWQGKRDPTSHALQPDLKKFRDMKRLCEEIHSLGLKAGIYSTPWVRSYANRLGGSAENPIGDPQDFPGKHPRNRKVLPYAVGRFSFASADAQQWADWGIDYLKYDWNPIETSQVKEMADALNKSSRDIVYSLSNQASINVADDLSHLANCWRTTNDIQDRWSIVQSIGFSQDKWASYTGPGHYSDPDMLVVGYVGWGPRLHLTRLTPDEQYTHISLWSLLSAPLLLGCDLDRLDPFTVNLLTNDEVLAVDQDSLCRQAISTKISDHIMVYVKVLQDGARAVGIFNLGNESETSTVQFSAIHITGRQLIRDLWRQKDLSVSGDQIQTTVSRHGVVLLRLTPQI